MTRHASPQAAVQCYIEGVAKGDAEALGSAFHADARMYGALAGQRVDISIAEMIAMVTAQPADVDGTFQATIRGVEEHGDVATVVLDEESFWGTLSFTDVLTLARMDDGWTIVSKAFTHTGGTPPGA